MPDDQPGHASLFDLLSRRRRLLHAVSTGPRGIRDLRDELGASRSTVYKATRELEAADLVERVDGGFQLTLFGRLLLDRFESFSASATDLASVEPILSTLPSTLPLDPAVFSGATVVAAEPHAPDRPIEALESFVRNSTDVSSFAPVTRQRYLSLGAEEILSGSLTIEMVTERDVVEYVLSEYRETMTTLLETGQVEFYQTDDHLPYGIAVRHDPERRVGITLYDDDRQMQAFVENDAPRAYEWGADQFERVRDRATRLAPSPEAD